LEPQAAEIRTTTASKNGIAINGFFMVLQFQIESTIAVIPIVAKGDCHFQQQSHGYTFAQTYAADRRRSRYRRTHYGLGVSESEGQIGEGKKARELWTMQRSLL